MPIYEYACKACEHEFETIQKVSEAPLVDCPACGRADLRKKVSAVAFRLKGGGWYETDFKSGGKRNLHGEEAAARKEAGGESGDGGQAKEAKEAKGGKEAKEQGGATAAGKSGKGEGKSGSSNGKPAAAGSGGAKAKAAVPGD